MLKEDIIEVKKEVDELKKESFAFEMLKDYKKQNKRLFVIWIITFIALIGMTCYLVYLLNDITTITDEYTQEISDIESIDNSNIINGGK